MPDTLSDILNGTHLALHGVHTYYMIDFDSPFQLFAESQDSEFIPLITEEDEKAMHKQDVPDNIPLLSLRNTVLFPGVVIPITVGRDRSINLIKEANKNKTSIGVVSQKDGKTEDPQVRI